MILVFEIGNLKLKRFIYFLIRFDLEVNCWVLSEKCWDLSMEILFEEVELFFFF